MSLMLLAALYSPDAMAAKVYWVGDPDDADRAAVGRTVEGATSAPFDEIVPSVRTVDTMSLLADEATACKALFDVFDGELQVMARLQKATSDVRVVRSDADRLLLYRAWMMQGYAVQRYFQAKVGTEKAAAPYRTGTADDAVITSWANAAAMYEGPTPTLQDLPDAPSRLAFDATQAAVRGRPSGTVVIGTLAAGATVSLDGKQVPAVAGTRLLVNAGRHFVHVQVGERVLWAYADDVAPNATIQVDAPFGPAERDALVSQLASGKDGWSVAPGLVAMAHGEPTYLAIPGDKQPRLVRVDGAAAQDVKIVVEAKQGGGPLVRVSAGAGWLSSGDFFLQNIDAQAPYEKSTVNAVAPAAAVGAAWRFGWLEVGAGVDAQVALGEFHSLPTGESATRTFVYPHVAVGIPYAQLTLGPQFPWYVGVGGQATIPLVGPLELYARGVYGVPVSIARGDGAPAFEPTAAISAWGGVALRFGG